MGERAFISIIMPVYNASDCLQRAVESVITQSYNDWELILVNDASTDNTAELCKSICERDNRIVTLNRPQNGGVGPARNDGVDYAAGDYMTFMDADDFMEEGLLLRAATLLSEHKSDVLVYAMAEQHRNELGKSVLDVRYKPSDKIITDKQTLRNEVITLENLTLYGYATNKFYKTSHFKGENLRFSGIPLYEDIILNIEFFMNAQSAVFVSDMYYHYYRNVNGNSVTAQFVPDYYPSVCTRVKALYDQHKNWDMDTPEIRRALATYFVRYTFSALWRNCDPRSKLDHKGRKSFLQNSVYSSRLYADLKADIAPTNKLMRIFGKQLQKQRILIPLLLGRIIYTVKKLHPNMYASLSRNR